MVAGSFNELLNKKDNDIPHLGHCLAPPDHHHHQVVVLGPLVRQVTGGPPQEVCREGARGEGVEDSVLAGVSVDETDELHRTID